MLLIVTKHLITFFLLIKLFCLVTYFLCIYNWILNCHFLYAILIYLNCVITCITYNDHEYTNLISNCTTFFQLLFQICSVFNLTLIFQIIHPFSFKYHTYNYFFILSKQTPIFQSNNYTPNKDSLSLVDQ